MQFEPADMQDLVSMQTGDFAYSLPLGDVPGPYGSYPLSISYHAGISPQQEATWVGLGWTLNPGVINRDVRGVPDDQFHGGTLGFIYQYSAMQTWNMDLGWSIGFISIGSSCSSQSGVGFSATIGPRIAGVVGVGFTVGTEAVGLSASVGYQNIGLNSSLLFSTVDGSFSARVSVDATMGSAQASAGVQYTSGKKVSYNVGFGVGSGQTQVGVSVSPNGVSYHASAGALSMSTGKQGTSVSVGGNSLSVSNASTKGGNHTSTIGFAIVVPTAVGVFSLGFSQSLHEYHMRSATSDYVYGYIYQAGPSIVADGKNDISGMPDASAGSYNGNGDIPWKWTLKGRTLESMGNEELHPAYDMYSVSSEGFSGSFRPFAREEHQLYMKVSNEKTNQNKSVENYSTILLDSADSGWPYENEFSLSVNGNLVDNKYPSYDYCVHADSCSPYALYATRFRNEGNRLVYRKNKEVADTTRTGMTFLFAGENGGYFESEIVGEGQGRVKNALSSKLLRRSLNDYQYALYGSRKVEPIFEEDNPVGKLQGFVMTASDGTRYYFEQPIRSYLNADYSINKEKGAPIFVDRSGNETEDFWKNFGTGLWKMLSYGWGRSSVLESGATLFFDPGWGIEGVAKTITNVLFRAGSLSETCSTSDDQNDDYFYSYQVNMNPYATQWLLTEIRGADFVQLGDSISDNVGYNVKINYTGPSLYRWRSPFARPGLRIDDMPNFRMAKNGYTPEGCDSRMYQASFGLKEYVYVKSIETATHKVEFKLNNPVERERVDGKGWDISTEQRAGELPIMVQTTIGFGVDAYALQDFSSHMYTEGGTQKMVFKKKVFWTPKWLYVNSKPPVSVLNILKKGRGLSVMNFDAVSLPEHFLSSDYNTKFYEMNSEVTLKVLDTSVVMERTTGNETRFGLYKIRVSDVKNSSYVSYRLFEDGDDARNYSLSDSLIVLGENGTIQMNPYINWGDLIWAQDSLDPLENQMRYLEKISYYNKQDSTPYREFLFGYDYSLHPKTLNSYCSGHYPDSLSDILNSPDSASLDVCANDTNRALYGKLTLKSITEKGCQNGRCASLPPFRFSYNSPAATSSRASTKEGWVSLSQGLNIIGDNDNDTVSQYPEKYYEHLTDVDASIIASSNGVDDWGFWGRYATSENHKVEQSFADYGAASWSLNKIVDPAGSVLEVEYERDIYRNGEDYANDMRYADIVGFGRCGDYTSKQDYSDAIYGVTAENADRLCMELGDLYWREQCLGPRVAFWDTIRPAGYVGTGFEYMDSLHIKDSLNTLFYNIKANIGTKVRCGLFGWGRCSRTRSVALLGDAQYVTTLTSDNSERRLLVLNRSWNNIEAGLQRAADKINSSQKWKVKDGSRMGVLWSRQSIPEMKGGDLRVTRLTRYDIDRTAQTEYEYAPGEMAQLPDSAYNTVLGNRFYSSKISYALPDVNMRPKSRIVGFNDDDLFYIPGSRITYPKVTVKNTEANGSILNGRTEFDYITPESGVPVEFVDSSTRSLFVPFLKVNVQLFKWGGEEGDDNYGYRSFLVGFFLLDSLKNQIGATRNILVREDGFTSLVFYAQNIRNARYLKAVSSFNKSEDAQTAEIVIGDTLTNFNEMNVSVLWNLSDENSFNLNRSWLRSQKDGFYPILYRQVEYATEGIVLAEIDDSDEDQDTVADFESRVTYHDLTAFVGLNYKTVFYRGNNNAIPIKVDSSIFSTIVPDIMEGVVTGSPSDTVRKKVGRQVERWHYDRELQCTNENKGNDDICEAQYPLLFERDSKKDSKNFVYIRYPVFQIGSFSYTGHENQAVGGSVGLWGNTALENHRFDPLTGSPTATLARTPAADEKEARKLTQKTPHYAVTGDTSLANEMFRRNMLSQNFLDELYSGLVTDVSAWNSIATVDSLRSFSISPYRLVPDSVLSGTRVPIVAWGTYKSKDEPSNLISGNDVLSALSIYQNAASRLPSLELFSGTHIRSVDGHFKVREMEDAWGRTLASHYSADGMYQTGLFFPATLAQTAQVVPSQKSIAIENCTVTGSGYSVNPASGGIHASGTVSFGCTLSTTSFVAEYRIKRASTGKWETLRQLPASNSTSFALTLNNGDVLNYLRIYPGDAEAKTYLYDSYGNLVQVVAEDNTSTYYEYDPFGKLLQVRDDDGVSFKSHWREFMNDDRDTIPVTSGN